MLNTNRKVIGLIISLIALLVIICITSNYLFRQPSG